MPHRGRAALSRTAVLEAGIALADAEGLAAVTMRRLGEQLGVEAMSLYRYVDSKQDVLDGMASLLVGRMAPGGVSAVTPWQDVLRQISLAYRRLIVAHPAVFTAQAGRAIVLDEQRNALDLVLATLGAAGFPHDVALDIYQVGSSYARGFALTEVAEQDAGHELPRGADADRAFALGLDVMIDGFERLLATTPQPPVTPTGSADPAADGDVGPR